nr:MAG TPA: Nuclease [Caudoviricetes sp.]
MNKKTVDSEKVVERKLVELVKMNGGMCIKLLCDQLMGLPDRMCLFPGHKMVFVELKTTGRKPKRIQMYMHNKLQALGFRVEVIDTIKGVEQLINNMLDGKRS